jgi:hypothetical protein
VAVGPPSIIFWAARHHLITRLSCLAVLGEKDIKVLTISEVAVLFEEYTRNAQQRDPEYLPNPMLLKAAEYAARFATNTNRETVQKIRE